MPIYEYVCEACHAGFEHLQRTMGGSTRPDCPKCASKKTKRKLSVFAVATNGGGKSEQFTEDSEAPSCGRCGGAPGSCAM